MATPERKIFSCTEIHLKEIQSTKKEFFLTCSISKLKFSLTQTVPSQFRELKKEQVEWLPGKSSASRTHTLLKHRSVAQIMGNTLIFILTLICFKRWVIISVRLLSNTVRLTISKCK